jgi:histidine ammonia-lyase
VLAVELLTAARGIQLRAPLQPSAATGAVINALRKVTEGPGVDRFMAPEIEATVQFLASGDVLRAVETVTGPLD